MIELGSNRYGKRAISLVRVGRSGERHRLRDLTLDIALEGDFAAAHVDADNANVIATDTMKNTAYAFATEHLAGAIEELGIALAGHFGRIPHVERATVELREHHWVPLVGAGGTVLDAFQRLGDLIRTARVVVAGDTVRVESGIAELTVMKTSRSAFAGFARDRYTTLPEAADRIMATRITASWRHADANGVEFDAVNASATRTLLEVFADHDSCSVQHSVWLIGRAILERHAGIEEVSLRLPNLHHWLVDLAPFGVPNEGEVFVATTEPYGEVEATICRSMQEPRP